MPLRKFIEATQRLGCEEDLVSAFHEYVGSFGIDVASYHVITDELEGVPLDEGMMFHSFPEHWANYYMDNELLGLDPIIQHAFSTTDPFHWFDIGNRVTLDHRQIAFIDDLRSTGLKDGIAVPVFGSCGGYAYFGLGSRDKLLNLSEAQVRELQFACYQLHLRFLEIRRSRSDDPDQLSAREREVMNLIARGLSNGEISESLSVSAHTVDTLVRRCFRKLNVTNRVSASLKAVGSGIIIP